MITERWIFAEEHHAFRQSLRGWLQARVVPRYPEFEAAGHIAKDVWLAAGTQGFLGLDVAEEYGGGGVADWRFSAIVTEEIWNQDVPGFALPLHNDIVIPYITRLGDDDQKARWLPQMVSGASVGAIAMSEPGMGSDLAAVATTAERRGDRYVINGGKTFISNGAIADVIIVVCRTGRSRTRADISLVVVEGDADGFSRGSQLQKIGMHAQDTSELHFDDVQVPVSNLLGEEGRGFGYLMAGLSQERLVVAIGAVAGAVTAYRRTLDYVRDRRAFSRPIADFQVNRFSLAEMATELEMAQVFIDRCIELHADGQLRPEVAAMAKWWATELQFRVTDRCLQLHGGYGYVEEYPIARSFRDSRVQRIYAGTNEIMKDLVGRAISSGRLM